MRRLVALAVAVALAVTAPAAAYKNGRLPAKALAPINTGFKCPGKLGTIAMRAAAGYNTMALAAGKPLPTNGCDSAYRPYSRQVYWREYWCARGACGNAAVPGTSNHGLGLAVDVPLWVREHIDRHGAKFGFSKWCSDAPHEWWHVKFCLSFERPNPGLNLNRPTLRKGSGGPGQRKYVRAVQRHLNRHAARYGWRRVKVTGEFGKATAHAVRRFQRHYGLKPTGVVKGRTWRKLRAPAIPPLPKAKGAVNGLDVSQWQGSVNWRKVRAGGAEFAVVKATEGEDWRDPTFSRARLRSIRRAGLVAGTYHFLRPKPGRPGGREARFYARTIRKAGQGPGDMRPVLDVEWTALPAPDTCRYVIGAARALRKRVGTAPIIYTYPSFASTYLAACKQLQRYPLWIAHYGVTTPVVPRPWRRWWIWQHTDQGVFPGVGGLVDLNRVQGGIAALRTLRMPRG